MLHLELGGILFETQQVLQLSLQCWQLLKVGMRQQ